MNAHSPRPPSIDLAKRFEAEVLKCAALRDHYAREGETDRAGNARLLGCATFWACIALEELVASGAASVEAPELHEIISLREALDHPLSDPDVALRAYDKLKAFAAAA